MSYDIGTARGVVELEYNGRGIDQAQQDLAGLDSKGQAAAAGTAKAMNRVGLAIVAGLGAGVVAAANFEERMSAVGAVSGASEKQLESLRAKALQLGKDTQFSATESANAMEELVKAGLTVDDVLNGAADATVALAAAGEVDMATAATVASAAMNSFGLEASEVGHVADIFAGAANASATGVAELGDSFRYVAPLANAMGVSIDDTVAGLAALADVGITGTQAGTTLRAMLQNLNPATDKAAAAMKQLGIITEDGQNRFFTAKGEVKSMSEISGILAQSLNGLSAEQKSQALNTIFGARAMAGATALADKGSKGFDKLNKTIQNTSAADVAAKRMDNFKGSLEEFMGSLETVGIQVGTILLPPLREVVDALSAALDAFLGLSEGTQKFAVGATAGVAGMLLLVANLIKLILWGRKVQIMLAGTRLAFIGTWAAALGPIAAVIAAIALIVGIIVLLWKKNETFRNAVITAWNAIKAAALAVANWFMTSVVPILAAVWNAIVAGVRIGWAIVTGVIRTAWNIIMAVVRAGRAVVVGIIQAWNATIGRIVRAAWQLIIAVIKLAWVVIKGVVILAVRGVVNAVRAAWNIVRSVTSAVWNGIKAVISGVMKVLNALVGNQVRAIFNAIKAAWNLAKSITTTVWNSLKGVVDKAVDGVMSVVKGIPGKVKGALSGAGSWLLDTGKQIVQGLINGIESMIDNLRGAVGKLTGALGRFLPGSPVKEGPLKVLNHGYAGKQIVQMIIDGIKVMEPALNAAVTQSLPNGYAAPAPGSLAKPSPPPASQDPSGLRLVGGELTLSPDGRAFIRGVAVEADDDENDFDDLLSRMS